MSALMLWLMWNSVCPIKWISSDALTWQSSSTPRSAPWKLAAFCTHTCHTYVTKRRGGGTYRLLELEVEHVHGDLEDLGQELEQHGVHALHARHTVCKRRARGRQHVLLIQKLQTAVSAMTQSRVHEWRHLDAGMCLRYIATRPVDDDAEEDKQDTQRLHLVLGHWI